MAVRSIVQDSKVCLFCLKEEPMHKHHIYEGHNRQRSEKNGLFVYLCPEHHRLAHEDGRYEKLLKRHGQRMFEKTHTRDAFVRLIGKNYLDDEEEENANRL